MTDIDAAIAKYETKIAEQRRQANSSSLDAAPSYSMHHDDQHNAEFLPSDGNTPQDKHKRVLGHGTAAAAAAATPQPWAKSTAHSAHSAAAELVTPRSSQRLGQAVASPARSVSSSNLRASGEYVVESPTSLYDRTLRWASNRDKAVARQASEKEDCVLQDCTFRPNVSRASNPSLTPNRASRRPQASGDASSYHLHIQRQEGARRDKMEAQKRVDVDISHWAPRITAPKEFSFAQRQGHITSLRKPVYRVEGLLGEDVPKPNSPNAPKEPPTARRAKTPSQRQNVSSQHQHHHGADDIQLSDDEDLLRPSLEQELREANARIGSLTRDLHASRAKHAAYEEEIAALNGTMIGLRRELEAAKNKLRQMALATAHHTL